MQGNNTLNLCPAVIIAAVQKYFDDVLFREGASPKVEQVSERDGVSNGFDVKVSERKPADAP